MMFKEGEFVEIVEVIGIEKLSIILLRGLLALS